MNNLEEKTSYEKINPFTGIWVRTRETVRYVIEEKSFGYVMMLIILGGILNAFAGVVDPEMNLPLWGMLLVGIIVGPIAGLIGIAFITGVYLLIGKLFKGTGTYGEMFKAIAASTIPTIWMAPFLLIGYLVVPDIMLLTPEAELTPLSVIVSGLVAIVTVVISIWSILIQSKAIGEAHRFSSWKGFFTLLIPGIIGFILIMLLVVGIIAAVMGTY